MRARVQATALVLVALSFTSFATAAPVNDAKLRAYGKRLSVQCTTCHRIDSAKDGLSTIVGWSDEDFIWVLKAYRDGGRTDPAMVSAAQGLNEIQLRALARFFGSIKPAVRLR